MSFRDQCISYISIKPNKTKKLIILNISLKRKQFQLYIDDIINIVKHFHQYLNYLFHLPNQIFLIISPLFTFIQYFSMFFFLHL